MKNNYFSYLKSVAIFFVVGIHLNNFGFNLNIESLNFKLTALLRLMILPAVPVFFAISGYFTESSNKKHYDNLKKQIPRILMPYFIWASIYSIYNLFQGLNFNKIIFDFFTFQTETPFYFVFLILIYYLIFPLISWFSDSKLKLFIAFLITITTSVMYQYYSKNSNNSLPTIISLGNPCSFFIYPVLGSYIAKNNNIKTSFLMLLFFLLLSVAESIFLMRSTNNIITSFTTLKPMNVIYCSYLILYIFKFKNKNIRQTVFSKIGDSSYYIYFSHLFSLIIISKFTHTLNFIQQIILMIIIPYILYFFMSFFRFLGEKKLKKIGF